uniref:Putative olfactory receptor OR41 n=1 Tax=Colaphellus bowringi TaxID=561076 RepID=A0A0S3J2Q8_9CUCU|nr:putative olfactory receptor OR41 [Colaphellus bowringi]
MAFEASEEIHNQLQNIPWHRWNVKNQKILLNYLIHTTQPLNISPFESLVVNRIMVVQGLKMVMSMVAVCRTLRERFSTQ